MDFFPDFEDDLEEDFDLAGSDFFWLFDSFTAGFFEDFFEPEDFDFGELCFFTFLAELLLDDDLDFCELCFFTFLDELLLDEDFDFCLEIEEPDFRFKTDEDLDDCLRIEELCDLVEDLR